MMYWRVCIHMCAYVCVYVCVCVCVPGMRLTEFEVVVDFKSGTLATNDPHVHGFRQAVSGSVDARL